MATQFGVQAQLKVLEGAYNPPRADGGRIVKSWLIGLGDVSDDELREAVQDYLRSDSSYHPKPGQLRAIALRQRSEHQKVAQVESVFVADDGSCTTCGAPMELLTPDGQPMPETWLEEPPPRNASAEQLMAWGSKATSSKVVQAGARYGWRHYRPHHHDGAPATGDHETDRPWR